MMTPRPSLLAMLLLACAPEAKDDRSEVPSDTDPQSETDGDTDGARDTDGPTLPTSGAEAFGPLLQSGSRLQAWGFSVDEDAVVLAQIVDSETGEACSVRHGTDGVLRCLPDGVDPWVATNADTVWFADAACTERVVAASPRCQPSAFFTVQEQGVTGCPQTEPWVVHALTPRPERPLLRRIIRGECRDITQANANDWFDVGDPVPPSTFARVETFSRVSDAGLGAHGVRSADGLRVVLGPWLPGVEAACSPHWMREDDTLRCLPEDAPTVQRDEDGYWWGDDTCSTEPLAVAEPTGCPVPALVREAWYDRDGPYDAPDPTWQVSALDGVVEGTAWRQPTCAAFDTEAIPDRLFRVGAPVPVGSLPTLQEGLRAGAVWSTRFWLGEEGERVAPVTHHPFVDDSGVSCHPWTTGEGIVCLPSTAAWSPYGAGGVFADEACTQPLVELAEPPDIPPTLAFAAGEAVCLPFRFPDDDLVGRAFGVQLRGVWSLGDPYYGTVYREGLAGCAPSVRDLPDGTPYLATEVPWSDLPAVRLAPVP